MSALYFIHELVEHNYDFDDILDRVDIVFVPVANPGKFLTKSWLVSNKTKLFLKKYLILDGYVFTHTTDRMWNKNRRTVATGCVGADLSQNFGHRFLTSGDVRLEAVSYKTRNFNWSSFTALQFQLPRTFCLLRSWNSIDSWHFGCLSNTSSHVRQLKCLWPTNHNPIQLHWCWNLEPSHVDIFGQPSSHCDSICTSWSCLYSWCRWSP